MVVFNENESNIKRWTDGRNWTPSRVQGDFLVYRELEKNLDKIKKDKKSMKRNLNLKSLDTKKIMSSKYESLSIPTFRPDKFLIKADGLIKKTMSVTIKGQTFHMISYYKESDVLDNKFITPSESESLKKVVISNELLKQLKQPTQKAPPLEEIKMIKNMIIPNSESELNDTTNKNINSSSEIKKQPYMNISASVDNTVDINDLDMNRKINKNDEKLPIGNEEKSPNIEDMISQIDDNMHFLKISKGSPHILNQLQMNPELLHHVNNLNENHNILTENIKNSLSPLTTSSDHSLLSELTSSHSLLNDHHDISNIENHHNLNIETLYHQLDDQLHNENNNDQKDHSDDELFNLFMQLDNHIHIKNNHIKPENETHHDLLHHINPEVLNHFNISEHDLQELLLHEKDHHSHENIHDHINHQELLDYLTHHLNEEQKLSHNINIDDILHHLNAHNQTTTASIATSIPTTLNHSLHTDELNHIHNNNNIKSVVTPTHHNHELKEEITTKPSNKNTTEELGQNYSQQSEPLNENNMSHILQLLSSLKNIDMETLQNLLQIANHEHNFELAHYLESIIHMLNIEQHQHQQQQQQQINNEHQILSDQSMTSIHHNNNHEYDILHNHELFNQNLLNFMHVNDLHSILENSTTKGDINTHLHTTTDVTHSLPVTHIDPTHTLTSISPTITLPVSSVNPTHTLPVSHIDSLHTLPVSHIDPTHTLSVSHIDPAHTLSVSHIDSLHTLSVSHIDPTHTLSVSHIDPTQTLSVTHIDSPHTISVSHIDSLHTLPVSHIDPTHTLPVSHIDPTHTLSVSHIDPTHTLSVSHMDSIHTLPVSHIDPTNHLQSTTTLTSFPMQHLIHALTNETKPTPIQQHPSLTDPLNLSLLNHSSLTHTIHDDHMDHDHNLSSHHSDQMDHDHHLSSHPSDQMDHDQLDPMDHDHPITSLVFNNQHHI